MDKLIITVTVDSSMSYPGNPLCPPTENVPAFTACTPSSARCSLTAGACRASTTTAGAA